MTPKSMSLYIVTIVTVEKKCYRFNFCDMIESDYVNRMKNAVLIEKTDNCDYDYETLNFSLKMSYIFSKKAPPIFKKWKFSYILGKAYSEPFHNRTFPIFQEMDVQNPGLYFWKWSFLPLFFSYIEK